MTDDEFNSNMHCKGRSEPVKLRGRTKMLPAPPALIEKTGLVKIIKLSLVTGLK